ncbi:MAG TPA: DMT family transporter [Candidatus Kapabacteria bacterium]
MIPIQTIVSRSAHFFQHIKKLRHIQSDENRRAIGLVSIFSIPIVWGTTFAIVQRALLDATPTAFVTVRFTLVALTFLALSKSARLGTKLLFRARTSEERAFRNSIIVLGLSIGAGYIFQTVGLLTTTTSKSAFLTSTAVVWTPFVSRFTGREKITTKLIVAVALTIIGIFLMTNPLQSGGLAIGDLMTLSCAAVFGVYIVWVDKTMVHATEVTGDEHDATIMVVSTQLVIASALLLICLPIIETPHFSLTNYMIFALAFTSLVVTGATAYLQARYQNVVTPSTAAVIYMLEPVSAMVIAELFLTEQISFLEVLGAGLILFGVIIAQVKSPAKFSQLDGHAS